MIRFNTALVGIMLAGGVIASSAKADLLGLDVTVTEYSPDLSTITAGPVGPVAVDPTAVFSCCTLPQNGTLEVTGNQIIYTASVATTYAGGAFVGFVLDFTGGPRIISVTQDPSSNFDIGSSFTGNSVSMNFASVTSPFVGAQTILDVTAVPEPASWMMMLTGFAGLGVLGYRASRKAVLIAV